MDIQAVTQPENELVLDKNLKIGHFVLACLVALGALVGVYANNERTNGIQDERIKTLESQFTRIDGKSDKILDKVETLMILTANKADKSSK